MGDGGGGATAGEPLLAKRARYRPGCPGCRVDRRNEEREGVFPFGDLFRIWLVVVCSILLFRLRFIQVWPGATDKCKFGFVHFNISLSSVTAQ
ncbi:hypothetical protein PR202_ga23965 [Eleusine coracana subsp. coracana]|uniref:Uncharacterized protein n=1 Tax=Eleusine coracana subsp. coracana TaxID=191504 RepID=A0AAV5D764_ELECO|nr:hypothetical protein PR202_ga23965 [Eleusine coracana subsp. coracana]